MVWIGIQVLAPGPRGVGRPAEHDMTEQSKKSGRSSVIWIVVVAVMVLGGALALNAGVFKSREKLGLVTWNEDPFWDLMIMGANNAAHDLNVDLTVIKSKPDLEAQSKHVKD